MPFLLINRDEKNNILILKIRIKRYNIATK